MSRDSKPTRRTIRLAAWGFNLAVVLGTVLAWGFLALTLTLSFWLGHPAIAIILSTVVGLPLLLFTYFAFGGKVPHSWQARRFRREIMMLGPKDINLRDMDGRTPLMHAVRAEDAAADKIRLLLSSGADADAHDDVQSWTALHFAARAGKASIAQALLEGGAAVDPLDSSGNTPLWYAVTDGGSPDTVEKLVQGGADPQKRNGSGVSPVAVAERLGKIQLLKIMRRYAKTRGNRIAFVVWVILNVLIGLLAIGFVVYEAIDLWRLWRASH